MSKTHALKTWPYYFQVSWDGRKDWEIRRNDRGFAVGDIVILEEYDQIKHEYLGRQIAANVLEVIADAPGLQEGYVILSLEVIAKLEGGRIV